MSVIVVGANHRTVPLGLLERIAGTGERADKILAELADSEHLSEVAVLSTCNRVEVYGVTDRFHGAYTEIRRALSRCSHTEPEEIAPHLYHHWGPEAAAHLFGVAAGLDSAVLGEHEILGQVRDCWDRAREAGTARSGLHLLFRHALECGKRVRTLTAIGEGTASVSAAAVAMATEHLGGLEGRSVLVIGAGAVARRMCRALAGAGVTDIRIANRTPARASELAEAVGGTPLGLAEVPGALMAADVVLTSTGAGDLVVGHDEVAAAVAARRGRPLVVVDVAVPRDVDPAVGDLDGVTLLDMDDLRAFASRALAERQLVVDEARRIVAEAVDQWTDVVAAREAAPLISALRRRAEQIRSTVVARSSRRLGDLDDAQRAEIEAMTRRIVSTLLHDPTVALAEAAGSPRGEKLAEAVRDLFSLYDDR